MKDWLVTAAEALASLPRPDDSDYAEIMRRGTMHAGLYVPDRTDPQRPHRQDELYIVWRGTGTFVRDGERRRFGPGDVIFVPAAMAHRFEEFSEDFATWVVFWGVEGGEIPAGV